MLFVLLSKDRERIGIMKFQVVICIALGLLGTALSGPPVYPNDDFNGMIQQDVESEDYVGAIQQDVESEDYFGMIQQDIGSEGDDEMIQQDTATEEQDEAQAQTTVQLIGGLAPLYRYWKAAGGASDHFYTTNQLEIGTVFPGLVGRYGYRSEGVTCLIYTSRVAGSVPLYRYYLGGARSDHFYTTNPHEIGTVTPGATGKHGYRSEGIAGYCFPRPRPGTIPLYRYWHPAIADHFYTTNIQEIGIAVPGRRGRHGYVSEGVACHVIVYYQ